MAPSRSDRDWDTLDGTVETIDLTFSSPEPESQPQAQPQWQQRNTNYLKRESNSCSRSQVKHEHHPPGMAASNSPSALPRPINPQHIMQIINSSDTSALRKVLIDLCKMSPALSGAVARGLAPYSTFAQATINRHRSRPPLERIRQRIKHDPELVQPSSSSSKFRCVVPVVEHQSGRPITCPSVHTSAHPSVHLRSNSSANSPATSVKIEQQASLDDDSDTSSIIIDFPASCQRSPRSNNVLRAPTRDNLSEFAGPNDTQRLLKNQTASEAAPKSCIRCHQPLKGNVERCRYHLGSRVRIGGGRIVYDCCRKPFDAPGCTSGSHISEADQVQRSPLKRSQKSAPASPCSPHVSKKPRVL